MNAHRFLTFLALFSLAFFVVACTESQPVTQDNSGGAAGTQEEGSAVLPGDVSGDTDTSGTGDVTGGPNIIPEPPQENTLDQSFTMTVDEYSFTPSEIRVPEGSTVTITIDNIGERDHGFALPDFNVNKFLPAGKTVTFTFTADKKGTYSFFCSVPCGSGHGAMRGKLIVE